VSERFSAKGGRSYPARAGEPPPWAFFADPRPPAGPASFTLALSDLRIRIDGIDAAFARSLSGRFDAHAGPIGAKDLADVCVAFSRDERDYFIEPPKEAEFNPVWIACDGTRVRYVGYALAGWFDTASRSGAILLARGTYEPELRAVENFLRCATAWCAAVRGGAFVHGASAVRGGRGYLFFGESGAGKSTLSAVNRRATVVSDDLSLLLPRPGGGLDLVGSPFRGTYEEGPPVVGRFPLSAGFRIVKSDRAAVRPVPRALVFGQLVGNLTFVAEAFQQRPDLFAAVEAAFAAIPLFQLEFRKDDSYWDAIDAAGL
jgi:hypothetical protein